MSGKLKNEPKKFKKFLPFAKIDEERREVWGIVTAEVPDKDDEVCDYDGTKPYYLAVVEEFTKATGGENIFPLRAMHQLKAAGRGISIDCKDDTKEIWMGFKVEADDEWKLVKSFVYTGFSHGGTIVGDMKKDPKFKGCMRYVANPSEVSLVDNPCLGVAHFQLVKSDGTIELRKVGSGELVDPKPKSKKKSVVTRPRVSTYEQIRRAVYVESTDHNKENAVQRDVLTKAIEDIITSKLKARGLDKGMYEVGRLAEILQSLCYMRVSAEYESEAEGDESEVPDLIQADLESLIETFLAMATEETSELAAYSQAGGRSIYMTSTVNDLIKAANASLASHFKKSAAHHEKMEEVHKAMAEEHGDMADHHKAAKAEGDEGGFHKAAGSFHKAMSVHHMKKAAAHGAMATQCMKAGAGCAEAGEKAATVDVEKTVTATVPAVDPKAAAEVVAVDPKVTAAAPVTKTLAELMKEEIEKAQAAELETWKVSDEFKGLVKARVEEAKVAILKDADGELKKMFGDRVQPTDVKVAGPTLISRSGEVLTNLTEKSAGGANSTVPGKVPLDLEEFVTTTHTED